MTSLAIVAIRTAANEPPKARQVMNKIHRNVVAHEGRPGGLRGAGRVVDAEGREVGPVRGHVLAAEARESRVRLHGRELRGQQRNGRVPPVRSKMSNCYHT